MKKSTLAFLFFLLLSGSLLMAQVPTSFNFQAVARDASGTLLANTPIVAKFTLLKNVPLGVGVYAESHAVTTDSYGLFDLSVGTGTALFGTFSTIDWGTGASFLKVEIDLGAGYIEIGTQQILSVPYALFARETGPIKQIADSDENTYITTEYPYGQDTIVAYTNGIEALRFDGVHFEFGYQTNLFAGYGSGYAESGSYGNSFFGINSGRENTTGSNNTFVGYHAGAENIAGNQNSFLGTGSGSNFVEGNSNTYLGYLAGRSVRKGFSSVHIGAKAGEFSDSAANNVYIGESAGQVSKFSVFNTGIGTDALGSSTNSYGNVAIGDSALAINRSNFNVAVGFLAGHHNPTGTQNVFVGGNSGRHNNAGNYNTYLGYNTGRLNLNGSENVFIGDYAGENSGSGQRNVFIGNEAGRAATSSERLFIENSSSDTPLLFGEFDSDRVGINWNSLVSLPSTLSVNGNASKAVAGSWLANSDARLKTQIESLEAEAMLQKVLQMKGVSYEWKDDKTGIERPAGTQYGFIAQDLLQVWPEKVSEDQQGYLQTAYGDYDPMFVESIRALYKRIEALEAQVQLLQSK